LMVTSFSWTAILLAVLGARSMPYSSGIGNRLKEKGE
jgi:hypothetical protein